MWSKKTYNSNLNTKGGRWTLTDGTIYFDIHVLFDDSERKEQYPDGAVSHELANAYIQKILNILNDNWDVY